MENQYILLLFALVAVYAISVSDAQPPYSLNYNYFDQMAQSYCAASRKAWTFAIRRDCLRAPTCNALCAQAKSEILDSIGNRMTRVKCYDAFQIKKRHKYLSPNSMTFQPDQARLSMGTYGYGARGCIWRANSCGPNYCCCNAY